MPKSLSHRRPLNIQNNVFKKKSSTTQRRIIEALQIIDAFGIPLEGLTPRVLERTAVAFFAVADLQPGSPWAAAKDVTTFNGRTTKEVIVFTTAYWGESQSMGSYDSILRQDLVHLINAGVVEKSKPDEEPNSKNNGYALSLGFANLVRGYGKKGWADEVAIHLACFESLRSQYDAERKLKRTPVTLPDGRTIELGAGAHNKLQGAVINEFLPRFGHSASVLYVGDASNRTLSVAADELGRLQFPLSVHAELPDLIAYSAEKNWLFLIEAVHSGGPISKERRRKLRKMAAQCSASLIFVTAFHTRAVFRKFLADLAWEQEVWIADEPDHLVHFNGDKFLGPHESGQS